MTFFSPNIGLVKEQNRLDKDDNIVIFGKKTIKYYIFPDGLSCLFLLEYTKEEGNISKNVVLINDKDNIIWQPTPPRIPDAFVEMDLDGEFVYLTSFSGYRIKYNIDSFQPAEYEFTK
jgi:hypothetical protein